MAEKTDIGVSHSTLKDRLVCDDDVGEIRDGDIRYLMIRADALMGIFARLAPEVRKLALESFCESIAEFGGRSARSYRERGAAEPGAFLQVIAETAPQLGWGTWQFSGPQDGAIVLEVQNSPFVAGFGSSDHPVCAPIRGMLTAVAGFLMEGKVQVRETDCGACGSTSCRFVVDTAANRSGA